MLYLDTSAFLKLLVAEAHSTDLRDAISHGDLWSSVLLDVETHRAGHRLRLDATVIFEWLETVNLVMPSEATYAMARHIGATTLRTLDALHLATAIELGGGLAALVTYDRRLAAGAAELGVAVLAPGLSGSWWTE